MATKWNIARSGAMGKSFYQTTKSKWTRIDSGIGIESKTTDPQKSQVPQPGLPGTFMSLPIIPKKRKADHT